MIATAEKKKASGGTAPGVGFVVVSGAGRETAPEPAYEPETEVEPDGLWAPEADVSRFDYQWALRVDKRETTDITGVPGWQLHMATARLIYRATGGREKTLPAADMHFAEQAVKHQVRDYFRTAGRWDQYSVAVDTGLKTPAGDAIELRLKFVDGGTERCPFCARTLVGIDVVVPAELVAPQSSQDAESEAESVTEPSTALANAVRTGFWRRLFRFFKRAA